MASNIIVYTVITSGKDSVREQKYPVMRFIDSYDKFKDPRRNSRIQKILAHQYINAEYSIYIDGNVKLLADPQLLVDKYLKDCDLATYRHPNRNCIYDEAMECAKRKLDDPEIIIEQAQTYEDAGYAKKKGCCECGIILRRHTPKVEEFNNAWWSEYCRHSKRDQISFMYAVDKVGIQINMIPDYFLVTGKDSAIKQSGEFDIITHNNFI